jgi:glycogen operon protein
VLELGAPLVRGGVRFALRSAHATRAWLSLFDEAGEREAARVDLAREGPDLWSAAIEGAGEGARYGFRADGPDDPDRGFWFDPGKLLIDPCARRIDRPYVYDPRLAARRGEGGDTAPLMPKCVVERPLEPLPLRPPLFRPGGLIYELQVRSFTMRHPDVPQEKRGTVAALAEPAVIAHLQKLGVDAVELMPIAAWMDERHLPPLGLRNAWGYNPVSFMALDPRLAPGGLQELRETVAALHGAGIGVILDVVFNHTAESDAFGPTLSLRGLDAPSYFRHASDGRLVNDTGTGNTLNCEHPFTRALILDTLRLLVRETGVDGFRLDLAPVLGRTAHGFDPHAPLLEAMRADPLIGSRVLIAEPWDIGPGGYQLGRFGRPFLEWNDRFRDDVRRFWRGDGGLLGTLATRLSGSFDVFASERETRSLNFLAAHDGMTLHDVTAYAEKHNEANGEENRDGHGENFSWNNGVEGSSRNARVAAARERDIRALLATLFCSRGAIMLTAGDEWARTQGGNNNAYAQDNERFWLDWEGRDGILEAYAAALSALRRAFPELSASTELGPDTVQWLKENGAPLLPHEWSDGASRRLLMLLGRADAARLAVCVNGDRRASRFALPAREGWRWAAAPGLAADPTRSVPGRSVSFFVELAG